MESLSTQKCWVEERGRLFLGGEKDKRAGKKRKKIAEKKKCEIG
jgi:hypothetical protein